MASITVLVGEPPYGKERVYSAFRFALAALYEGHDVNLFLLEDAVFAAKKGQNPVEVQGLLDGKMPNCGELLAEAIKQGAVVKCCGVCCSERGLKQEYLLDGVEIGSMRDLVAWVVETDKFVSF
ncbi:MAG: DsrE family protein [Armatimonadota bacterium]|nr:DsrE family protein [Armatimonadota bacterium]